MDMADGAGVWSRGPGGSKHAGVADWHVEIDSGHMQVYGSVDLGKFSSEGGRWQKQRPEPGDNSALMQAMDNVCDAELTVPFLKKLPLRCTGVTFPALAA